MAYLNELNCSQSIAMSTNYDNGQRRITRAADLDLSADLPHVRHGRERPRFDNERMKRCLSARVPWYRRLLQKVRLWIATH